MKVCLVIGLILLTFGTAQACETLQSIINNAPSGSAIKLPCGTYRQQINIDKSLTVDGQNCVDIRGSDIWTGWVDAGGGLWTHSGSPDLPDVFGDCRGDDNARCNWPEQVFIDGVQLVQVASGATPTTGQFKTSGEGGTITIADDPTGKTVEVTVRWEAVQVSSSNVTVQNLIIKHLATPVYLGGIFQNNTPSNVTIRNNHISYIHSSGIITDNANNWIIENNILIYNGQHGIGGGGDGITNITVRGNTLAFNNTEDFEPGHSAGGMKLALVNGGLWENNLVYDNAGSGLWCDVDCQNVVIRNNTIYNNENSGVFYEISSDCEISGNKVYNNGWGFYEWCYGADILVASSSRCEVFNNITAWSPKGIVALSQNRPPFNTAMTEVTIHNNVMVLDTLVGEMFFTGWCQDFSPTPDPIYDAEAGNVGANNRFWITGEGNPDGFSWNNSLMNITNCNATACGSGTNSYLTSTEKNIILSGAGIPTTPPAHP